MKPLEPGKVARIKELLVLGWTNKATAREVGTSARAVRKYREQLGIGAYARGIARKCEFILPDGEECGANCQVQDPPRCYNHNPEFKDHQVREKFGSVPRLDHGVSPAAYFRALDALATERESWSFRLQERFGVQESAIENAVDNGDVGVVREDPGRGGQRRQILRLTEQGRERLRLRP